MSASQPEKEIQTFLYRDVQGAVLYRVQRWVDASGDKTFVMHHQEEGEWVPGRSYEPLPYRLPELASASPTEPVFICEGEKNADDVAALGFVATTNDSGATSWTR